MSSLARDRTRRSELSRETKFSGANGDREKSFFLFSSQKSRIDAIRDGHTYIQVSLIPPWEDQCEWHRMTRMTGPDCAVMCNLINIHTWINASGIE